MQKINLFMEQQYFQKQTEIFCLDREDVALKVKNKLSINIYIIDILLHHIEI